MGLQWFSQLLVDHALSDEFEMINQLLKMRSAANLTQVELARLMGTQKSKITMGI